jgi:hypothetical protein
MTLPIMPMTPIVESGQLKFILSWPNGPKDLDLYSTFKVKKNSICEVYFGRKNCVGVNSDVGSEQGGTLGVESVTIQSLGKYIYMFAVNKYIDKSQSVASGDTASVYTLDDNQPKKTSSCTMSKVPDTTLANSLATVSVYSSKFMMKVLKVTVPNNINDSDILIKSAVGPKDLKNYNWWVAFCLDGSKGIDSIKTVNKFSATKPDISYCESLFK